MKYLKKASILLLFWVIAISSYAQTDSLTPAQMSQLAWDYCYGNNGKLQNFDEAVKWAKQATEKGDAKGTYILGICYYIGRGVPQNYAEAAKWIKQSAEQGFTNAQEFLASLYQNGEGVEQSYKEAAQWYIKAAEKGNVTAQYNLAIYYDNGYGVNKNYAEAAKWYRKAAEQGDALAQCNLGHLYYDGEGVEQNFEKAVYWYKKSAESGVAEAQYNLGICYIKGEGVQQNIDLATKWINEAAKKNHKEAIDAQKVLAQMASVNALAPNYTADNINNVPNNMPQQPLSQQQGTQPTPLEKRPLEKQPLKPLGNNSLGSSQEESFSDRTAKAIGDTFTKTTDHVVSVFGQAIESGLSMTGYPYLSANLGASRMFGEFFRLKACLGGLAGYELYGGVGKDWMFNGKNKDKLAWHAGIGYYMAIDENKEFTMGITYSENPIEEGGALGMDLAYTYYLPSTKNILGFFGGAGFGIGNLKEALKSKEGEEFKGTFIWDISIGISIKLFANKN